MSSQETSKPSNIIESFKILKGNTRISVICELAWGIPYVMFNFYLSLYMKEMGITDKQIGYLISIGFITGTIFSLIAGAVTDRLGRKWTTTIFDFVSWPVSVAIYLFSHNFLMFAVATFVNSSGRILMVSFNMMVVEDADNNQRTAAFNLINIINISTGFLIPLGGLLVSSLGIVHAERIFFIFAIISMSTMMIIRSYFYKETSVGQQILEEHKRNPVKVKIKNVLPLKAVRILKGKPKAKMVVAAYILFGIYLPLGTTSSLYFAPYMTEVLKFSKAAVSILGGVYSAVLFIVFVFINPVIGKFNKIVNMVTGLIIQALSMFLLVMIPSNSLIITSACIILYASGFGIFKPFLDSLLAEVTEGRERSGIYSIISTALCILTAIIGFISGSLFTINPRLIYMVSMVILIACAALLGLFLKSGKHAHPDSNSFEA